ncbi:efflux RND transporter periplasmic adaptor subunit [Sphingosinicella sp. LHD-64]|uniref:efflux RND transporter periplasmic adaptor subunit n=1 Tax=Sphingosinicella sp. LHD-64 TaxID=3072139 RepID=UPI00280FF056|nr:efflux RND transporter periplasmic adaptor subunit [Sphingosinicella sp. LHD-64]MDQ8756045.1 efflux RND transporter periplasmic adaptor subunit [Sphingosinicella sp. LHD-64]
MNFESSKWRRDALDDVVVDEETLVRRRRRRNIILAVVAIALIAILAVFLLGGSGEKAAAPAGDQGQQLPAVTVMVPGTQDVVAMISATGSLNARRDMQVGVPGEGGQVVRVLAEPGQWVNAGQVLAVIDRRVQTQEAAQLAAQIEVNRADLRLAENELQRAQALVGRGFISQADVDRRRATRDATAARVRVAEAQLAGTRARISQLDVRAPTAGLILARNIEAGQVVSGGSGWVFRMAQNGEMELRAQLQQSDLARLSAGVPVTVTPVGSDRSYQGTVWQVSPIIDPQTRQGDARILIPYNEDLRPGGFASAEIRAGSRTAPLLPESAVQSDARGNFVYLVDNNNTVVRRDVQIGEVTDRGMAIVSGLQGNERIVESAGAFLNPGQRVRPELRRARNTR